MGRGGGGRGSGRHGAGKGAPTPTEEPQPTFGGARTTAPTSTADATVGSTGFSFNSGTIPKLEGKTAQDYRDYVREVKFWCAETSLSENRRGPALIRHLSGRAKDLVEGLEVEDVAVAGGVELILQTLRELETEPEQRIEARADEFFTLQRKHGEGFSEFLGRADLTRTHLRREDASFDCGESFWCLYVLRRAGLSASQRAQVLTLTAGTYTKEPLYRALRTLGPLFLKEKNTSHDARPVQEESVKRRRWYSSNVADAEEDESWDQDAEAHAADAQFEEEPHEEEADEEPYAPEELDDIEYEAFQAFQTAKDQLSKIKSARGYFKPKPDKGKSKGKGKGKFKGKDREKSLADLKKDSYCRTCGQQGHWSGDAACSGKGKGKDKDVSGVYFVDVAGQKTDELPFQHVQSPSSSFASKNNYNRSNQDQYYAAYMLDDCCAQRCPHDAFSADAHNDVPVGHGIADTGCQRVVCGEGWLNPHLDHLRANCGVKEDQIIWRPERRRFRFGNDKYETSYWSCEFPVCIYGRIGVIRTSVVPGSTTLLISRPTLKAMGVTLDIGNDTISVASIDVKPRAVLMSRSGHYLLPLCDLYVPTSAELGCPTVAAPEVTVFASEQVPSIQPPRHVSSSRRSGMGRFLRRAFFVLTAIEAAAGIARVPPADEVAAVASGGPSAVVQERQEQGEALHPCSTSRPELLPLDARSCGHDQAARSTAVCEVPADALSVRQRERQGDLCVGRDSAVCRGGRHDERAVRQEGGDSDRGEGRADGVDLVSNPAFPPGPEPGPNSSVARFSFEEGGTDEGGRDGALDDADWIDEEVMMTSKERGQVVKSLRRGVRAAQRHVHRCTADLTKGFLQVGFNDLDLSWTAREQGWSVLEPCLSLQEMPSLKEAVCSLQPSLIYTWVDDVHLDAARVTTLWNKVQDYRGVIVLVHPHGLRLPYVRELRQPQFFHEQAGIVTNNSAVMDYLAKYFRGVRQRGGVEDLREVDRLRYLFEQWNPGDLFSAFGVDDAEDPDLAQVRQQQPDRREVAESAVRLDQLSEDLQNKIRARAGLPPEPHIPHLLRPGRYEQRSAPDDEVPDDDPGADDLRQHGDPDVQRGHDSSEPRVQKGVYVLGAPYDHICWNHEDDMPKVTNKELTLIAKLHDNLAHPPNSTLARHVRLAGGKLSLLRWISCMSCAVCDRLKPPTRARAATHHSPIAFNQVVGCDHFFFVGICGKTWHVFHAVDYLTGYQSARVVESESAAACSQALIDCWLSWAGAPTTLVHDQGTGFVSGVFISLAERHNILLAPVPTEAQWKNGHAERHGSILKAMMLKVIEQSNVITPLEMNMCVSQCTSAKNQMLRKAGVSPAQAVLGREPDVPEAVLSHPEAVATHQLMITDEKYRRQSIIRLEAQRAFVDLDNHEGLRRALIHNHVTVDYRPDVGAQVFFWASQRGGMQPIKRGSKNWKGDPRGWHGPAVVIAWQGTNSLWVRFSNQLLQLPLEFVRAATSEELMSYHEVANELDATTTEIDLMSKGVRGYRVYKPKPARQQPPGGQGPPQQPPVPPAPPPQAPAPPPAAEAPQPQPPEESEDVEQPPPAAPPAPSTEAGAQVRRAFQDLDRLDGHPSKMRRLGPEALPMPLESDVSLAADEAFMTDFVVSDVDYASEEEDEHLDFLRWQQDRGDLDVGYDYIHGYDIVDEETHHAYLTRVEKPGRAEKRWGNLTPEQKKKFMLAMQKEWRQLFALGALTLLTVEESRRIMEHEPGRIMPSRWILTDKYDGLSKETIIQDQRKRGVAPGHEIFSKEKARWVVGGHRDPDLGKQIEMGAPTSSSTATTTSWGTLRTDAPTSDLLGQHLVCLIAAMFNWVLASTDVSNAFLRGKKISRNLYIRLPRPCIEGINDKRLARLEKGMYGLSEAPRLWWEAYSATLKGLGFKQSRLMPAVFIRHNKDGLLDAIVGLHVDDALIAADRDTIDALRRALEEVYEYGSWEENTFRYTGRSFSRDGSDVIISMDDYAQQIAYIEVEAGRQLSDALNEYEISIYRGKVGQLSWLARMLRPDLSFHTSLAQQTLPTATVEDLLNLNKVIRKARTASRTLRFKQLDPSCLMVLALSDASHANMPGKGSQAGRILALTEEGVKFRRTPTNILSWSSHRLRRVVRSTIAAEVMGVAASVEHAEFGRCCLMEILQENFNIRCWQNFHQVPIAWVMDAKAAYDSLTSETSLPEDKRLAIDVAALRQVRDEAAYPDEHQIRWLPGPQMPVDCLTKALGSEEPLFDIMDNAEFCLVELESVATERARGAALRRERTAKKHFYKTTTST